MFKELKIFVVVPAYQESTQISKVLTTIPSYVDGVVVVDDASTDDTSDLTATIAENDRRIVLIKHEINRGVGSAIETGYREAIAQGAEIIAVMAGDGQMDPDKLELLLAPIAEGKADYAKGNRLSLNFDLTAIPKHRKFGNIVLSFLTRFATGYWILSDAQNGFTAASEKLVTVFLKNRIYPRYGVPNDLLLTCALHGARVLDVPILARYGVGETSKMKPSRVALPILALLTRGFFKRLYIRHLIIETNPLPVTYILGIAGSFVGSVWGSILVGRSFTSLISAVEVIAVATLLLGGILFLIFSIILDIILSQLHNQQASQL